METKTSKGLNIALWILQFILAAFFLMAGITKYTTSLEEQRATMEWPKHVPGVLIHIVGIFEIAGALGLLLPSLLRIQPRLTPWAAVGLGLIMVLAVLLNLSIGETKASVLLIVAVLAFFVAWGRLKKAPILPK